MWERMAGPPSADVCGGQLGMGKLLGEIFAPLLRDGAEGPTRVPPRHHAALPGSSGSIC